MVTTLDDTASLISLIGKSFGFFHGNAMSNLQNPLVSLSPLTTTFILLIQIFLVGDTMESGCLFCANTQSDCIEAMGKYATFIITTFDSSLQRILTDFKDYERLKVKLENRRLDFDGKIQALLHSSLLCWLNSTNFINLKGEYQGTSNIFIFIFITTLLRGRGDEAAQSQV
jgi:hypothetical protein